MASNCVICQSTSRLLMRVKTVERTHARGCAVKVRAVDREGAVIDRPAFERGGKATAETESGIGSTDRIGRISGGGSYRVLLMDSPKHTEEQVVKAIVTTIPGTDAEHGRNCYHTSKSLGMALVTTALLEIAEFYSQELYKRGCRTTIEPDSTVL